MGLLPKRMRKNPVSAASSAPSFAAMIERINDVNAGDVPKLSDPRSVSPAMRLSLATFLEEWTESDVGHEKYLENLLTGFDDNEAIKMGDLLEWMAIGTDKQFDNEVSMPKGVDHKELVCLHAELLDFLPLKSYNTFTMVTLLEDDPELVEEVFNNYVELTATEHDALQALSTIVKRGSVESIRLFLEASPKHSEKGYGFTQTDNYGSLLVDTFELCRRASVAYKDGNYMGAKALLGQLFDEKGIDAEMVRMDISKMALMVLLLSGEGGMRGPGERVLVSVIRSALTLEDLKGKGSAPTSSDSSKKTDSLIGTVISDVSFNNSSGKGGEEKLFYKGGGKTFSVRAEKDKDDLIKKFQSGYDEASAEITDDNTQDEDLTFQVRIKKDKPKNRNEYFAFEWEIVKGSITQATEDDEEDDEEEEEEAEEETRRIRRNPDDKLSNAEILNIVRIHGMEVKAGKKKKGAKDKGPSKLVCDATNLFEKIYSTKKQGHQLKFVIHAFLDGTPSSDFIPKGTVTFTANEKVGGGNNYFINMVVDVLPAHEVERKSLVRTKVDPLDKAIEGADAETRRNPSVRDYEGIHHHGDGPYEKQTQAREIAKIMAERGEDMYMWQVHLPKDSTYGFGDGWMISQDHPTNVPANQVRRFPASSKPKNNPDWVPYKLKDISVSQNRKKYPKRKIPKLVMYDYPHYEIVEGPYKGTVLWAVSAGYVDDEGRHLLGFATGGTYVGGGKAWQVDEYEEPSVARLHGKAIVGKNNPEEDEEWDMSVGAPVKKSKAQKSISDVIGKGKKTRIDSVELGYDDKEDQTRQILQKRKMDPEDWKESLERQGYGTNPKGPGKKRTSAVGNTYAIDLIPRSSVKLTQKDVKFSNKILHRWRDTSAEMKAFWKKYTSTGAGGGKTVYVADKTFKTKYFQMKKGQTWNSNRPPLIPEMTAELKERLQDRNTTKSEYMKRELKKFISKGTLIPKPGTQQAKQTGESYVTYKGGKVSMRMILARHKESGSLVPYRLLLPAAAFRMEGDTLVPRSGSADSKGAKQLLGLIENSFGKISFHKNMGKGGLKVGRINVDEGVAKVFKTGGLKTEGGAVARPYLFDDKRLTYIAKGRQYTMELA